MRLHSIAFLLINKFQSPGGYYIMIKLPLMELLEEYLYNKTIVANTDLEISFLERDEDIDELENRKANLNTRLSLVDKYDYEYILTSTEIAMIKAMYIDKPTEKMYEKFNLTESQFEDWINILKKKLKKINIYIAG